MISANIEKFPGYKDVADLLVERKLIIYKQIWSVCYHHYLDEAGDLQNRLILELTQDRNAYDIPTIRMIFKKPSNINMQPDRAIIQLSIDDLRTDGWEHRIFRVYDAEMDTDWELYCEAIAFERGQQKPLFVEKDTL